MCDAKLKFNYLAVSSPGGMPDMKAYCECLLHDQIEAFPIGFHVVGDPAYTLTEKLLIPYSGPQQAETNNNVFNFFLSQLRIQIEMAFGLLTMKWRIFCRPLEGNMATMKNTILAARPSEMVVNAAKKWLQQVREHNRSLVNALEDTN